MTYPGTRGRRVRPDTSLVTPGMPSDLTRLACPYIQAAKVRTAIRRLIVRLLISTSTLWTKSPTSVLAAERLLTIRQACAGTWNGLRLPVQALPCVGSSPVSHFPST